MSEFYNPQRAQAWNYGGKNWRLSRSKIDLFLECPRCFYIDNKLGVKRPPGFPFSLNAAVDFLLKKEFDAHRKNKTSHPLMEKYGLNVIPFDHEDMDKWRDSLKAGIEFFHEETGMNISGGVDDVWINPDTGELHIVDYKATSKDTEVNLDSDWQDGYKRQMEVYQWLFRKNGFNVSDTGYFVYVNGKRDKEAFDARLEFDVSILPYKGNDSWVEKVLRDIKKNLEEKNIPEASKHCDYCLYKSAVSKVEKEDDSKKSKTNTLF
jgi:CRISPR/Cas system-associated exonuclease Cas4 (RecB family)